MITPQDLHSCGAALCSGSLEVEYRASVSRSYYAAYHAVTAWYTNIVPGSDVGPPGGKHQQFVNCLRNPAATNPEPVRQKSKVIGAQLDVMRIARLKADYALAETVTVSEAQNLSSLASLLIEKAGTPPP